MDVVTRGALHLVSLKGLDAVWKHSSPVRLKNHGLIELRILVEGGKGHRKGMVVAQVFREISDRGVVRAGKAAIGPFISIVAFGAGVRTGFAFQGHPMFYSGFRNVMKTRWF